MAMPLLHKQAEPLLTRENSRGLMRTSSHSKLFNEKALEVDINVSALACHCLFFLAFVLHGVPCLPQLVDAYLQSFRRNSRAPLHRLTKGAL